MKSRQTTLAIVIIQVIAPLLIPTFGGGETKFIPLGNILVVVVEDIRHPVPKEVDSIVDP